jgi:formiminoglutamase
VSLTPINPDLLFSKHDPSDPRLGEQVQLVADLQSITNDDRVIIGHPDDDGIRLNGGRPGAALAPSAIRKVLYKMTPTMNSTQKPVRLKDVGDLSISKQSLTERHGEAQKAVMEILSRGGRAACLGGGHDYGFPDFAAFCENTLKQGHRPFVINFDAHLDVRPDDKGPHSGTPFYKLLSRYGDKIDFFEVGLQDWCNAHTHRQWALDRGAHLHNLSDLEASDLSLSEYVTRFIFSKWTSNHRLALSVDMDGFPSSVVPGASQVFPVGLDPREFLKMWTQILKSYRPNLVGFYETSPPLDVDDRSSKLAAILLYGFICSN